MADDSSVKVEQKKMVSFEKERWPPVSADEVQGEARFVGYAR